MTSVTVLRRRNQRTTVENQAMRRRSDHTSRTTRFGVAALALIVGFLSMASPAGAHSFNQPLVYLDVTDQAMGGRVEFPVDALRKDFDLTLEGSGDDLLAELEPFLPQLQQFADDHFEVIIDGTSQPIAWDGIDLLSEEDGDQALNFVQLGFDVEGLNGDIPRVFDVRFDPFFDDLDDFNALLLVGNDTGTGIFENGEEALVAFDPGSRTQTIDLGNTSAWANFSSSVGLGVDHIKTGPDHILFILVLLLPSVLVFKHGWQPQESFGSSLWRVLKIVTMFTIAHTITFSLAGLGILPLPPSKLVESIIAISIALAALHNIRPIAPNKEWMIAFGFGLFHGMGFATLVEGLDVSRSTQLVSLLGRNVGIEIGQAAVVLGGFTALYWLRRTRFYLPGYVAASLALALVSIGWMVERVLEVELGINDIVEPVLKFPRVVWLALIGTAIAGAIRWSEQRAGRLLPVGDDAEDAPALDQLDSRVAP